MKAKRNECDLGVSDEPKEKLRQPRLRVLDEETTLNDIQQEKHKQTNYNTSDDGPKKSNVSLLKYIMRFLCELEVLVKGFCSKHGLREEFLFTFLPVIYILLNSFLFFSLSNSLSFLVFGGYLVLYLILIIIRGLFIFYRWNKKLIIGSVIMKIILLCGFSTVYLSFIHPYEKTCLIVILFATKINLIFITILKVIMYINFRFRNAIIFVLSLLIFGLFIFLFTVIDDFLWIFIYLLSTIIDLFIHVANLKSKKKYYFLVDNMFIWITLLIYNFVKIISYPKDIPKFEFWVCKQLKPF